MNNNDSDYQEHFNQWTCIICSGNLTADRPPVYNPENCSCAQAGSLVNDPGTAAAALQRFSFGYNLSHPHAPFAPAPAQTQDSSSPSDDGSVEVQEGVETRDPNNPHLRVAPANDLGESSRCRHATFDHLDPSVPYSMPPHLTTRFNHSWEPERQGRGFSPQNTYMIGSGGGSSTAAATKEEAGVGSMMISGEMSGSSSTSGTRAFDIYQGIGDWAEGSGSSNGGWSTECILDEDDDQDIMG